MAERENIGKTLETNTPKKKSYLKSTIHEPVTKDKPLTPKEKLFVDKFMETNNATQAAIYAGYSEKTAPSIGSQKLNKLNVNFEIKKRQEEMKKSSIATAQEVMEYFTKVMNGEIKDQFGLEAPLSERTKAATELARRTVDLENRAAGKADAHLTIKLDWGREDE